MNMMRPERGDTRPHGRIADIEVLRATAVLMVLFEHLPLNLVFWNSTTLTTIDSYLRGWTGVDLFFAISGFVLARTLLPSLAGCETPLDFQLVAIRFWIRRAWRLLPSAWLWLAVPLLLCLVFNRSGAFQTFRANWEGGLAALLDVANFRIGEIYGARSTGISFPYWSLSLEEQFYLVLPVLAFLCRRFLAQLLLLVVAWQFVRANMPIDMTTRCGALALGVLLAIWSGHPSWRLWEPRPLGRSRLLRLACFALPLACLLALAADDSRIVSFRIGLIALLSAALVWMASYDGDYLLRDGRLRRLLLWLASRSYGIYVIHIPAYAFMHEAWVRHTTADHPARLEAVAYALAGMLLLLAVAELNYVLIENPLRRRGIRISNRMSLPVPVHPAI